MNRKIILLDRFQRAIEKYPVTNNISGNEYKQDILNRFDKAVGEAYYTSEEKRIINTVYRKIINDCNGESDNYYHFYNASCFNNISNRNNVIKSAMLKTIEDIRGII